MNSQFADFLERFGKLVETPLFPDKHQTCLLRIGSKLTAQIEMNESRGQLQLAFPIIELHPGKFRETVLFFALKENQMPLIQIGILGYSEKTNRLVLFYNFRLDEVTPEKVHTHLQLLIPRALKWYDAISEGRSAPPELMTQQRDERNPFGLKP